MSPLLSLFLRRVAVGAVALAVLLLVGPRLLREFGLAGPRPAQLVESAARSLEAARAYGAEDDLPTYRAAAAELERARGFLARGENGAVRKAAAVATEQAIAAQRQALARREDERRTAQAIVDDVDRRLNELEDLYPRAAERLDKAARGRLFGRMKEARQIGAGLVLGYEQGNYRRVIAEGPAVRATLAEVRDELRAAGR